MSIDSTTPAGQEGDPAPPQSPESDTAPAPDAPDAPDESTEPEPPSPPVVDVETLDWEALRPAVDPAPLRARGRTIVEALERMFDAEGGPSLLFDGDRANADDRAVLVSALDPAAPLWFIGDLHGDLLALEAALALIRREAPASSAACGHWSDDALLPPAVRVVFLGDLFDDGGYGLEVLLRTFELVVAAPDRVCVIAGNHDEALQPDGDRFTSSVEPSDFADLLNANAGDELVSRAGRLAVRLFERAPRALFFPDGLLVAHGGIPLTDLHAELAERGDWNDPRCLQDFVWTRAHPRARRKIPNRVSRGSQFGHEDFADFCHLATALGRPVRRMVRGHDHVDERFAMYPAWATHPLLTTVALSRRLAREPFGPDVRVPTIARWVPGTLPQVFRLHLPPDLVLDCFGDELGESPAAPPTHADCAGGPLSDGGTA